MDLLDHRQQPRKFQGLDVSLLQRALKDAQVDMIARIGAAVTWPGFLYYPFSN